MSTKGYVAIERTGFSHCSTTSLAGAVSCTVVGLMMKGICCYNCNSYATIGNADTYNAAKINGVQSNSAIEINQCSFALCPNEKTEKDETVVIWDNCLVTFKENNFTDNAELRAELIMFGTSVVVKDSMIFCNLNRCVSGNTIYVFLAIIIEKCNFNGTKANDYRTLFFNEDFVSLKDCVLAHNDLSSLFNKNNCDVSSCFFCSNKFSHNWNEACVPTLKLDLLDAESCQRCTSWFSKQSEFVSLSKIFIILVFQLD